MRTFHLVTLLSVMCSGSAFAQPIPRVEAGWMNLDEPAWTNAQWHAAVGDVYRTWRQYLLANPHLQQPTRFWSSVEQRQWSAYDLTAGLAYQGMPATVLDIRPTSDRGDEFVVRTLFAAVPADLGVARPIALTRVYAVRENDRWVFANALPRLTRAWPRQTVGPITYVVHPDMTLDVGRAERLVTFADSLAANLGVPRIDQLTYVMAPNADELHRVMGFEWAPGDGSTGYSMPWNHLILSGNPIFREAHRHEVTHHIMSPILAERRTHGIINEGLAVLMGGGPGGRTYPELLRDYRSYLRDRPEIGLDSVLNYVGPGDNGWHPTGAVLVQLVYEKGGWPAVRRLLTSGRSNEELKAALESLLDMDWNEIVSAWKAKITTASVD